MTTKELAAFEGATLEQRMKYAETLAHGGDLLPRGLRGPDGRPSPGKILLVAETGSMLGMHPVAAIQGVNIIDGKPTISPAMMSAVVRRAGHKLRVTTQGSVKDGTFTATATLIRSDDPDAPFVATWNAERAARANLLGKSNWTNYFEAMCKARAISEVCREGAEDALMGVGYVPEELGAEVDESGNVIEGDDVEPPAVQRPAQVASAPSAPERDWAADIASAATVEALTAVYRDAQQAGAFGDVVTFAGVEQTVESALWEQKKLLEETPVELVEAKPAKARARDWVREARALGADQLRALIVEASAGGASESVIEQMEDLYRSLPVEPEEGAEGEWAAAGEDDRWQGKPAVLDSVDLAEAEREYVQSGAAEGLIEGAPASSDGEPF